MNKLLVIINSPPTFAFIDKSIDRDWRDSGLGDWLGFYDVLRNESGHPQGVRFWPFEDAAKLISRLEASSNVRFGDAGNSICLLFRPDAEWVESRSGDQWMEEARLLLGPSGSLALLFGFDVMPTEERRRLWMSIGLRV